MICLHPIENRCANVCYNDLFCIHWLRIYNPEHCLTAAMVGHPKRCLCQYVGHYRPDGTKRHVYKETIVKNIWYKCGFITWNNNKKRKFNQKTCLWVCCYTMRTGVTSMIRAFGMPRGDSIIATNGESCINRNIRRDVWAVAQYIRGAG